MGIFGANYGANYNLVGITNGVILSGTHATQIYDIRGRQEKPKPKKSKYIINAYAKTTHTITLRAKAQIKKLAEMNASSKITYLSESVIRAKISLVTIPKTNMFVYEKDDNLADTYKKQEAVEEHIREGKKLKLKKIYDLLKDI